MIDASRRKIPGAKSVRKMVKLPCLQTHGPLLLTARPFSNIRGVAPGNIRGPGLRP